MNAYFAVFGDVHGRVALMLTLARLWQRHSGQALDGILQVGDMGAFPDPGKLDSATARHAANDLDELGFQDFIRPTDVGDRLLGDADAPAVAFCRGNHEDFDYLGGFRAPTAVDPWGKLYFIPDGHALEWPLRAGGGMRIGALGGAAPTVEDRGQGRKARGLRKQAHKLTALTPRFLPQDAEDAFRGERLDVLLSHAGPDHPALPGGSSHLGALAARVRPRAHLFGHHHVVFGPQATDSGLVAGLEHLEFTRAGALRDGSWGILHLGEAGPRFTWMTEKEAPWVREVHRHTWRQLLD